MCGIVGIFGKPGEQNTKVFCDMLQMDVIRGWDSTGVLSVRENGDYFWLKDVGVPQVLMRDVDFKAKITSALVDDEHKLLLGHNRAATKGTINADNAHPFDHDHIVMVHNGTVYSKYKLEKGYNGTFQTDSEAICWSTAKYGIKATYKKIDGAATLVWWDDKYKRLNIVSNGKRPFHYGYTKGRKQIIFASEEWMIKSATARHKIEIEKGKIFGLSNHHLWKFRLSRRGKVVGEVEELVPFVRPVIEKSTVVRRKEIDEDDHRRAWESYLGVPAEPRNAAQKIIQGEDRKSTNPWLGRIVASVKDNGQARLGNGHNGGPALDGDGAGDEDKDFTGPNWGELRRKNMDEITFHNIFKKCHFCDKDLINEFEEAVILDDRSAACEECQIIAELQNLNMVAML